MEDDVQEAYYIHQPEHHDTYEIRGGYSGMDLRMHPGPSRRVMPVIGRHFRRFTPLVRMPSGKIVYPLPRVIVPHREREALAASLEDDSKSVIPYANEETVVTTAGGQRLVEERESVNFDGLEDVVNEEEVDMAAVEEVDEGELAMPRPGLHYERSPTTKLLMERHTLKTRLSSLMESNSRLRGELTVTKDENRRMHVKCAKTDKILERQAVQIANLERLATEMRKKVREYETKNERMQAMQQRRKKILSVMPCLPNRKVNFSRATKQAQSLRVRLLNKYLTELVGPVDPERRLEEKNLLVYRWRRANIPNTSQEVGRQLLPSEEEAFCDRFQISPACKKEMKRWLGHKHMDIFGPSERALKVREWRRLQREKRERGEMGTYALPSELEEAKDEAGTDSDEDEELMRDVEDEYCDGEEIIVERAPEEEEELQEKVTIYDNDPMMLHLA